MNSSYTIKFNSNPLDGDTIETIESTTNQFTDITYINYPFTNQIINNPIFQNQVIIGSNISETITNTYNYLQNGNNLRSYEVSADYINNEITVTSNTENTEYTVVQNTSQGRIDLTTDNGTVIIPFTIDNISYSEADTDPCNRVKLTVDTNIQATNITDPIVGTVTTNPYVFETLRDYINVTMNNANNSDSEFVPIPRIVPADFSLTTVIAPNSGTVTVNPPNYRSAPIFTLEYSLNSIEWYPSNSFSGLPDGSYNMYIRDGLGCSFSIPFDIVLPNQEVPPTPQVYERKEFYFLSNLNSFRYKICEDLNTVIPTVFNTLSYEENVENPEKNYKQPYQKNDGLITTQIKSSYEINEAVLIDSNLNETSLTVIQKSENIGITDVRDGTVISIQYLNEQYIAVKFVSGNIYDPDTNQVTGSYSLGDSLPSWFDIGDFIFINGAGWVKIIDIIGINGTQVCVMNYLTSSFPFNVPPSGLLLQITSIYNLLDYELYEFNVDLTNLEGCYQIRIDLTDSEFEPVSFLSERIEVLDNHPKTHLVKWYNTTNNEINYATGFFGKARFSYIYNLAWTPESQQEVFLSDTNTTQIDSNVRENYIVSLRELPTAMAQKFILLCGNNRIYIDDLNFIKEATSETLRIGGRNLYQITQQLIRSDYTFEQIISDENISINSGMPLAIEGIGKGLLFIE